MKLQSGFSGGLNPPFSRSVVGEGLSLEGDTLSVVVETLFGVGDTKCAVEAARFVQGGARSVVRDTRSLGQETRSLGDTGLGMGVTRPVHWTEDLLVLVFFLDRWDVKRFSLCLVRFWGTDLSTLPASLLTETKNVPLFILI